MAGQLRARNYRRGRLGSLICLSYLALVVGAAAFTGLDALVGENLDASFAGVPLVMLTAPSSILSVALFDVVQSPGPPWVSYVLNLAVLVALGCVQAFLGWLVLRGAAVTASPD